MNRADLAWQLFAVMPHCGKQHAYVGLRVGGGECWVWATDTYTIGVTRKASDDAPIFTYLPKAEALDLARGLRPKNKAQEAEQVQLVTRDGELYVRVESVLNIKDGEDTAVYETCEGRIDLDTCMDRIAYINDLPVGTSPQVLNPDLYGRFAAAKASEEDRMTFWHRETKGIKVQLGAGVAVVGDSFIGACLGMVQPPAVEVLHSFLQKGEQAA